MSSVSLPVGGLGVSDANLLTTGMNSKNCPLLYFGLSFIGAIACPSRFFPAGMGAVILVLLGTLPAGASDGDVDPVFDPGPSGTVFAPAVQPDGKIVAGGSFFTLGGVSRFNFGQLHANGALETGFHPSVNSEVYSAAVLEDGKFIIAGTFDAVDGVARNHIARLNSNGSVDSGFRPVVGRFVFCTLVQPDGKVIIGGTFTNVGGTMRNRIARINADGTLDMSFNPDANRISVRSLSLQPNGQIIVGGSFTNVGGLSRNRIARLNSDGTLDASFDPNADGIVYCSLVQPDGKIVIGGFFESVGGQARNRIARLHADGTLDTSIDPDASFTVNTLAQQADGKILVGGYFATLGGVPRNYLGRLNPDGTVDMTFNSDVGSQVDSVALQADGKVIIGGGFANVGGLARNHMARLENSTATQTLSVFPNSSRVEWLRGGSSPETHHVTFDWSTNAGMSWTTCGTGTRIPGGWECSNVILPVAGLVRARARTSGGIYSSSSGLLETIVAFDFAAPEIGLQYPSGLELVDGLSSIDFGSLVIGTSNRLTFTVTNSGTAALLLGDILVEGSHADEFSVEAPGLTTLPPGGSTTFNVSFLPAAAGPRSAALHLASNDGDENPFDIALRGEGVVPLDNLPPISIDLVPSGVRLRFDAIRDRSYTIERALTLDGPWINLDTIIASADALLEYVDINPPAASAFYRTRSP